MSVKERLARKEGMKRAKSDADLLREAAAILESFDGYVRIPAIMEEDAASETDLARLDLADALGRMGSADDGYDLPARRLGQAIRFLADMVG